MIGIYNNYQPGHGFNGYVGGYESSLKTGITENNNTNVSGVKTDALKTDASSGSNHVTKGECQTCKERKYQDGSDEMVSFKSAAHISPTAAPAVVRGHEQEHVSNAYKSAYQNNGKVLQASVSIHTAICPECGRTYISGGTTTTQIAFKDDEYSNNLKSALSEATTGGNIDLSV